LSLREKTLNGIRWTTLSTGIRTLIYLAQISILTHYLDRADFGLMSIVNVVISFSSIFLDMGISNAIICRQDITHKQLSTLYWINILTGIIMFGLIYLLSPFVGNFYNDSSLKNLIFLVALTFIIMPFGQQFKILFQKELEFKVIGIIEIISFFLAFVITIYMAINKFGVYTLVYNNLVLSLISTLLFLIFGLKFHRPSLVFNFNEIKSLFNFGMCQIAYSVIGVFNSQVDTLIIGKTMGFEALGIYGLVKSFVMRPADVINPIVTKVSFPVMSQVQDEPDKLKNIYLKTINHLSSINFPIYIIMAIFAEALVETLFGHKWHSAIIPVSILSISTLIRSTINPLGSLIFAKGRVDIIFYWTFAQLIFTPLSIYIGSRWGIVGICCTFMLLNSILFFAQYYFIIRNLIHASLFEFVNSMTLPLKTSLIMAMFVIFIPLLFKTYLYQLIFGIIFGTIFYIAVNLKFNKDFVRFIVDLMGDKISFLSRYFSSPINNSKSD